MSEEATTVASPVGEQPQAPRETIPINVICRSEQILDPGMDPVTKVGTMARLCYKSEPKEGEDETALNERIIRKCIQDGHESVLEHAVYSLFLPLEECHDSMHILEKITGLKAPTRSPFRAIWEANRTEAQSRLAMPFYDPDLYLAHKREQNLVDDKNVAIPCIIANARSWRLILREKLIVATQMADDPLEFVLVARIIQAFAKRAPIFFGDIAEMVNVGIGKLSEAESLSKDQIVTRVHKHIVSKLPTDKRSLDGMIEFFFDQPNDIFCGVASPMASLSVIFTTDRATTHQMVRHRKDVAYSQESQRWVNYDKKGCSVCHLAMEPSKYGQIIDNYDYGLVKEDTPIYKIWKSSVENAFDTYSQMLTVPLFEKEDSSSGTTEKVKVFAPPETAREVLQNCAATKLGVTWMLPGGFSNYAYWRLDKHAQYHIRSALARVLCQIIATGHPFSYSLDANHLKAWLIDLQAQYIFENNELIAKCIKSIDERMEAIAKIREEQRKLREEAEKKAEEEARAEAEKHKAQEEAPLPPGRTKPADVTHIHEPEVNPTPTEIVEERPPTVSFEKPTADEDISTAPSTPG